MRLWCENYSNQRSITERFCKLQRFTVKWRFRKTKQQLDGGEGGLGGNQHLYSAACWRHPALSGFSGHCAKDHSQMHPKPRRKASFYILSPRNGRTTSFFFLSGCYNLLTQQDSALSRHGEPRRWVFVSCREAAVGRKPESRCTGSVRLTAACKKPKQEELRKCWSCLSFRLLN